MALYISVPQPDVDYQKLIENDESILVQSIQYRERLKNIILQEIQRTTGKMSLGVISIIDMQHMNITSMIGDLKLHKKMSKINQFTQEKYPDTNCKIYMINCGMLIHTLIKIFSVFLSEKQKKRIVVLKSDYLQELEKEVSLDQLPVCIGGTCTVEVGSNELNVWWPRLQQSYINHSLA